MSETSPLTTILGQSVVRFRIRAHRVFADIAQTWCAHACTHPVDNTCARQLSEHIVTAFQTVFNRNPTTPEWVQGYLLHHGRPCNAGTIIAQLMMLPKDSKEDRLNPLKPWWVWYQIAGRNDQLALSTFAHSVLVQFVRETGKHVYVPDHIDMSDPEQYDAFIRGLFPPKENFWKSMWSRLRGAYIP